MALPLQGIRVLDASTALAGPVTCTMMGDFGADVVMIEEPNFGDPITRARANRPGRRSLQSAQEGRNKKSVGLDLRQQEGRDILRSLLPYFDVFVTNYRPPTLKRWGLLPDDLSTINPSAVLVYITGYGLNGPYSDRGAFDRVASAFSGLTYVSGNPDDPPTRCGYSIIDYMTSYMAAFSVVSALYYRDIHAGPGQVIDLALYESAFRASEDALLDYAVNGKRRERSGNRNNNIVPASDFLAADGRLVSIHAGTPTLFRKLAAAMDMPTLLNDERFASHDVRIANQDELYELIGAWVSDRKAEEVVQLLAAAGVPASPIMSIADIYDDPHYRARETITTVMDEDYGALEMVAPLPHMSHTPGQIRSPGRRLGQDTEHVLRTILELNDKTILHLRQNGIINEVSISE